MPRLSPLILKDIFPGLISILVFVLINKIEGMEVGIYVSMGFSILILFIYYLKEGHFIKFLMMDTFLLCIFGTISVISGNELFIKLKPVLTEVMLLTILWFSTYRSRNFILELSGRYINSIRILKDAPIKKGNSLSLLITLLFLHLIIVTYSAIFMVTIEWGLISSIALFIILIVFVIHGYFIENRDRKLFQGIEVIPLVNEYGTVIGRAIREDVHFNPNKKLLHPVVHMHVFNKKGELYLQKRLESKKVQPGKWDTAVGGHIGWGETVEESLMRETEEEIGLTKFSPVFQKSYIWETDVERELVYTFTIVTDALPEYNTEEISEARFWTIDEIKQNLGKEIITPNLEHEIEMMKLFE